MNEFVKNTIDFIYSAFSRLLGLYVITLFYVFLSPSVTMLAKKNEMARALKKEVYENTQKDEINEINFDAPYDCLSYDQFDNLLTKGYKNKRDSFGFRSFKINDFNIKALKQFKDNGNDLDFNIVLDKDTLIDSIDTYRLLLNSYEIFKREVGARYDDEKDKYNLENISAIELPMIKVSLPISFVLHSLLIAIWYQLLITMSKLTILKNIYSDKSSPLSKTVNETIQFYSKYYSPKLSFVFNAFILFLFMLIILMILLLLFEFIFYKPEYQFDSLYFIQLTLGWINFVTIVGLSILCIININKIKSLMIKRKD